MFISTSTNADFSIISSDLENLNEYDFNLSNKDNFCLWFASPIELTINFEYSLPHDLYLYESSFYNVHYIDPSDNEHDGKNLFFILDPSKENRYSGTATFHVSPKNVNDLNSNYYQVDHVFNIDGKNGILDPNSNNNPNELKPTSQPSKPKSNIIGIAVIIIIALIVIIVIIVVAVKCIKKHKKKKTNSSDENSDLVKI